MQLPKTFNKEELSVGAVVAASFIFFLLYYAILAIPLCAFLWALGGADKWNKNWRRLGVPIVICGLIALNQWSLLPLISIIPFHMTLRIGYGVPCGTDLGSDLGRWWTEALTPLKKPYSAITKEQMTQIDLFVRGTVACLIGISMLSLAFINLPNYLLSVLYLTILVPVVVVAVN